MGITTGLVPSLTLGCGTWGGNSTTNSVTYRDLLNIKRVAYYTPAPPVSAWRVERHMSQIEENGNDNSVQAMCKAPAIGR